MGIFGKSFSPKPAPGKAPMPQRPAPKPAPGKPKGMFEQKSHWTSSEFARRVAKDRLSIAGRGLTERERKQTVRDLFKGRGTHFDKHDVKRVMRDLRSKTAKGSYEQRVDARKKLDYLKKATGIRI